MPARGHGHTLRFALSKGSDVERRYRIRLNELLEDAEIPPGLLRGALPRLEAFLRPFLEQHSIIAGAARACHDSAITTSDMARKSHKPPPLATGSDVIAFPAE